jgi:hypothetical protein
VRACVLTTATFFGNDHRHSNQAKEIRRSIATVIKQSIIQRKMAQHTHRRMEDTVNGEEENQSCTLIVVIMSLLFVAVFGGALVGGVVSGDPSNGFFVTIIAVSSAAIIIAAVASLRCWCKRRRGADGYIKDSKGTFSSDDDEKDIKHRKERKSSKNAPNIKEVNAMRRSDVSALSPNTQDVGSCMTEGESGITSFAGRILLNRSRQRRSGFDFSSVVSGQPTRGRADPPDASEEVSSTSHGTKEMGPKDPSAARISMNGGIETIEEEDDDDVEVGLNTPSSTYARKQKGTARYEVDEESGIPQSTKVSRSLQHWEVHAFPHASTHLLLPHFLLQCQQRLLQHQLV